MGLPGVPRTRTRQPHGDLEAFIPAKADGPSRGSLMTTPTLVFQNDDESYAFDVVGLLMREVSFDGVVVKPTFTDATHGDVGGASVYAINHGGTSLNVDFPKGDVAAAASAIRQVASETGVTQFYCTGVCETKKTKKGGTTRFYLTTKCGTTSIFFF